MSDAALKRWGKVIAKRFDCRMSATDSGFTLVSESAEWANFADSTDGVAIDFEPGEAGDLRKRLRIVEKAMAKEIVAAPVAFAALPKSIARRKSRAKQEVVTRLAFGLSLSLSKNNRVRFTAYYLPSLKASCVCRGDDLLFSGGFEISVYGDQSRFDGCIPALLSEVKRAEAEFVESSGVKKELEVVTQRAAAKLRNLHSLYQVNSGQYAVLLGVARGGQQGDDAIEAEYLTRVQDTKDQFSLRTIFEPLSLGVVKCEVQYRKVQGGWEATLELNSKPLQFRAAN